MKKIAKDSEIVTPLIYNCVEYPDYGVHKKTGDVYSKKRGKWEKRESTVSGKNNPYPKLLLSVNGKVKTIQTHVAALETIKPNPQYKRPPTVPVKDWKVTPNSVKEVMRDRYQVNHINHNRQDYSLSNLEWTIREENIKAYQKHRKRQAA